MTPQTPFLYIYFSKILFRDQGLGKTLHSWLIPSLKHFRDISHLVVVPKSTLQNWHRELQRWTPDFIISTLSSWLWYQRRTCGNHHYQAHYSCLYYHIWNVLDRKGCFGGFFLLLVYHHLVYHHGSLSNWREDWSLTFFTRRRGIYVIAKKNSWITLWVGNFNSLIQ